MKAYKFLETQFEEISILNDIASILNWDMSTFMPEASANSRVAQLTYIEKVRHKKICKKKIKDAIDEASHSHDKLSLWQQANLREIKRVYDNYNSVEDTLIQAYIQASGKCEILWRSSKQNNDFKSLCEPFSELLKVVRKIAVSKGDYFKIDPYQALIDQFDPGRKIEDIEQIFEELEMFLPNFIDTVKERQNLKPSLSGTFLKEQQKRFCIETMQIFDFNFKQGRLDESTHPFCGGIPQDIRITTRYNEADFFSSLFGVIHETGHALYEYNLPKEWLTQPVGHAFGMALHESQSLLAEMQIGLSNEFIEYLQPKIIKYFNLNPTLFSVNNITSYLKYVEPSFIRVEADEVTYPLHIILRYHLEKKMISGELEIEDLPFAWNESFQKLFGLTPPSDSLGCLQDIHWPSGAFGYFPSYTLGALTAAQFMHKINRSIPEIKSNIRKGNLRLIYEWLKENIYSKGRLLSTDNLLITATGEKLNTKYFIQHLKDRYAI
jgi:carboxypeptidase Taq